MASQSVQSEGKIEKGRLRYICLGRAITGYGYTPALARPSLCMILEMQLASISDANLSGSGVLSVSGPRQPPGSWPWAAAQLSLYRTDHNTFSEVLLQEWIYDQHRQR